MSITDTNSNKESELQDMGDEEIHCKPLLNYIDGNLEIETGSQDGLQGVVQEGWF